MTRESLKSIILVLLVIAVCFEAIVIYVERKILREQRLALLAEGPENLDLSLNGAPELGKGSSNIVLIEFSEYACEYCARHAREVLPRLEAAYVKTGKIRYAVRNFPLALNRSESTVLARAALCAKDQGKYWQLHPLLYRKGDQAVPVNALAKQVGIDVSKFEKCLQGSEHDGTVLEDMADGRSAGVSGTPTFFLGTERPNGKIHVWRKIQGAVAFEHFRVLIDELLLQESSPKFNSF